MVFSVVYQVHIEVKTTIVKMEHVSNIFAVQVNREKNERMNFVDENLVNISDSK